MLSFEKSEDQPKVWEFYRDENLITPLTIDTPTIYNKFHIIGDFITNISKQQGKEFDEWIDSFIKEFSTSAPENKFEILSRNFPTLKRYVNEYIESTGIDFSQFVNGSLKS